MGGNMNVCEVWTLTFIRTEDGWYSNWGDKGYGQRDGWDKTCKRVVIFSLIFQCNRNLGYSDRRWQIDNREQKKNATATCSSTCSKVEEAHVMA